MPIASVPRSSARTNLSGELVGLGRCFWMPTMRFSSHRVLRQCGDGSDSGFASGMHVHVRTHATSVVLRYAQPRILLHSVRCEYTERS